MLYVEVKNRAKIFHRRLHPEYSAEGLLKALLSHESYGNYPRRSWSGGNG
jgi:hypothetical protein